MSHISVNNTNYKICFLQYVNDTRKPVAWVASVGLMFETSITHLGITSGVLTRIHRAIVDKWDLIKVVHRNDKIFSKSYQ